MSHQFIRSAIPAAILTLVIAVGCSKSPAPKDKADSKANTGAASAGPADEIAAAMAELSDADRQLAQAQGTCPVGGGPLGSMGKPYKVTVKGRDVFLCCDGCQEMIEKDPDKYLAKLDEAAKPKAE